MSIGNSFNRPRVRVAVLLATYNGAAFIEPQLRSLIDNNTAFCLHWLDDHSNDTTRDQVQALALKLGIDLHVCHQPIKLGVPGAFFQLLECAVADIYMFCDQDDVWQPGKIDATVANLLPDLHRPTLCYSEPWVFSEDRPQEQSRYFAFRRIAPSEAQVPSRAFALNPATGNTIGMTGALRELFLLHQSIALKYAAMHDWWLHLLALASGDSRLLSHAPTTLYRQHRNNTLGIGFGGSRKTIAAIWKRQQRNRLVIARQARGFLRVVPNLTILSPAARQLQDSAKLIAYFDKRRSLMQTWALFQQRALQVPWWRALPLALVAMLSDAAPAVEKRSSGGR